MNPLVIRADATTKMGVGHVIRCIALGQAWQDKGGKVVFVSYCEIAALKKRFLDEGFDLVSLDRPHPNPFDLENTLIVLNELRNRCQTKGLWLVVDGYHFDANYQQCVKEAGHKLLCIDDYGHAQHYHADIVLNQNISAVESFYTRRNPYTILLLGTRYVLLRREFKKWDGWQREIPPIARKVLITLGGSDPDNVTLKVVKEIKMVDIPGLEANIVVGHANPNLQILARTIGSNANLQIITNTTGMPELMAWADLAVSAGGSTCWELDYLGLPNMIIYFADNQRPIAEMLHAAGAALSLGRSSELASGDITKNLKHLLLSEGTRKRYSMNSRLLVDGSGAQRVCREILKAS